MMLTLLLMRHAESIGNQQLRMQGHSPYALSERGHQQAQCLGQRLAREFQFPTQLCSSPLVRSQQTTEIILKYQSSLVSPCYDLDLAEGKQGIFTGLTWAEACQHYPHLCQQLETTPDWIPIPGAESPQALRQRAQRWMARVLNQEQERIWVVTHEWILYHLVSVLLGSDRTWQFPVHHTALFEFSCDMDRWRQTAPNTRFNSTLWQIHRFNDTNHLNFG
ncbi:MAG: histidine phosphatase family protein [Merismopedia sp. SIO2A8]|nr:histidine phosphatase family protein [Merismopedia sp. SIO2A8]